MAQRASLRTRIRIVHSRGPRRAPIAWRYCLARRSRPAQVTHRVLCTFPQHRNSRPPEPSLRASPTAFSRTCQKLSAVASISGCSRPGNQLADTHRPPRRAPANCSSRSKPTSVGPTRSGPHRPRRQWRAAYFSVVVLLARRLDQRRQFLRLFKPAITPTASRRNLRVGVRQPCQCWGLRAGSRNGLTAPAECRDTHKAVNGLFPAPPVGGLGRPLDP